MITTSFAGRIGKDAEVDHDVASQVNAKLESSPVAGGATVPMTMMEKLSGTGA